MPKPINETIGTCTCSTPGCDCVADVRKMRGNGRLYLHCPDCLTIRPTGQRFQDYILENASLNGPGVPEPEPEPVPGKVPEPEPPEKPISTRPAPGSPPPKEGGILSFLNDWEL